MWHSAFQIFLQRWKIFLLLFCFQIDLQLHWWCCTTEQWGAYTFFWTWQYLLFTQLLKNHSASGADSRMLIHVLKQHFEEETLRSLQDHCWFFQTDSASVRKGTSWHLHLQVPGYILGTVQKISSFLSSIWCPNRRSCRGSPDAAWDKTTLCGSRSSAVPGAASQVTLL